ncbi:MAG: hypothetical protein QNJ34_12610, partial [Xenococcaceae cyanobacterium MO_188.B29]|nr:hypothetical protein [Xenococcaceae cyanobacterium MO_188.B29]
LLTVSVPIGLQFGETPGAIVNQSRFEGDNDFVGIQVDDGKTIALVASGITLDNGLLTAKEGRVELGSVAANSFVDLTQNAEGLSLSYDYVNQFEAISIINNALISTDTSIDLSSGNIQIYGGFIELNNSDILSRNNSEFNGGNILINAENLTIRDATIKTITFGNGRAASLTINANSIDLIQEEKETGLFSQTFLFFGKGGNLNINTNLLTIQNGAQISVSTIGAGEGGDLTVNASESIEVIGRSADNKFSSGLLAQSLGGDATGNAGNVHIDTRRLIVQDGGNISVGAIEDQTNPFRRGISQGNGGELVINASESVEVTGFGRNEQGEIAPSTLLSESQGIGDAGNLDITTPNLIVTDRGEVNVSATGTGVAGNLTINTQDITLDEGTLTAETNAGNQGNITITNENNLLLRNNSQITTNAQGTATGGDIEIDSDIIAAVNNSDITANAVEGAGGDINITAQLVGIEAREEESPNTNDITASSELGVDGTITIDNPNDDPLKGLLTVPSVPIDAARIFAQNVCKFEDGKIAKGSSFIITGRGGFVPTAADPIDNRDRVVNWAKREDIKVSEDGSVAVRQRSEQETLETSDRVIQQAQGLVIASDGTAWLTAESSNITLQNSGTDHPDCRS